MKPHIFKGYWRVYGAMRGRIKAGSIGQVIERVRCRIGTMKAPGRITIAEPEPSANVWVIRKGKLIDDNSLERYDEHEQYE